MERFNPNYVKKTQWTEEEIEEYYENIPKKSFRCGGTEIPWIDVVIDLDGTFDIQSVDEHSMCVYDDYLEPEGLDQLRMWKLGAI